MRAPCWRPAVLELERAKLAPVAAENWGGRSDTIVSANGSCPSGRAEWREIRPTRPTSEAMSAGAKGPIPPPSLN